MSRLHIAADGDTRIVMTRDFDAPRDLVFEAHTRPELLKRWFGVHHGFTLAICDIDLRPGGAYRYVWRQGDGTEMTVRGVYREVVRPERLVATEAFEQSWYPGESLITTTFDEDAGRTTLRMLMLYESRDARDAVLRSPMERGVSAGYDLLDGVLAELRA
jgi:uncharacterized protein YndB with AHSA1/START domain